MDSTTTLWIAGLIVTIVALLITLSIKNEEIAELKNNKKAFGRLANKIQLHSEFEATMLYYGYLAHLNARRAEEYDRALRWLFRNTATEPHNFASYYEFLDNMKDKQFLLSRDWKTKTLTVVPLKDLYSNAETAKEYIPKFREML